MEVHKAEAARVISSQNLVSDIIGNINRLGEGNRDKGTARENDYKYKDDINNKIEFLPAFSA
jgi:hypothetical protein